MRVERTITGALCARLCVGVGGCGREQVEPAVAWLVLVAACASVAGEVRGLAQAPFARRHHIAYRVGRF